MIFAWVVAALAQDTCPPADLPSLPSSVAVAWVSPLGRHVSNGTWLRVVPSSDIRAFLAELPEDQADVRLLQWLGLRSSSRPPQRRYKVVVFDMPRDRLCRPIPSGDELLAGVRPCDERHSGAKGRYEGCGFLTDRATGTPSALYTGAEWRELSRDGFCVLPLERFLAARPAKGSGSQARR
jgi:hypothetical protein